MSLKSVARLYQDEHDAGSRDQIILDYLASVANLEDDRIQKRLLEELIREYVVLEKRVDSLLKNTLPETVANDIKYGGKFMPRPYDCTILFSDIAGFTRLAESISGDLLIDFLDRLFQGMDELVTGFKGTKIKTIGDAYMAVFGAPCAYEDHPVMGVKAGMAFLKLVESFNSQNDQNLQIRVGIHTGRVMAADEGPFLKEERVLLEEVARRISTIAIRISAERELQENNKQLSIERIALQDANTALRAVLGNIEAEKQRIYKDMQVNIDKVIMPILQALSVELPKAQRKYAEILKTNLEEITSPFTSRFLYQYQSLTPTEITICSMIRNGLRTKEIAQLRAVSTATINRHRENIRKK
ncbi:MAG: LuxR C-terminal-related transcriptional regulator, partial [Syntrophales bacterium LBB04]|nr:LuxR C-terminal-related transcriptional regulator [Syntrophales bacterium LBB04]